MISGFGSEVVDVYTGGIPVEAVYAYGEQVWPENLEWYLSWTPASSLTSGDFSIWGRSYNFSEYSSTIYSWGGSTRGYLRGYVPGVVWDYFAVWDECSIETNVKSIGWAMFTDNPITAVSLPECECVGHQAFHNNYISYLYLPKCKEVQDMAFTACSYLSSISLPVCESINGGFGGTALVSVDLPACTWISGAFAECSSLTTVNLPVCEHIDQFTFENCTALTSLSIPACTWISGAFFGVSGMSSISLPICCSYVGPYTFVQCIFWMLIVFPGVERLERRAMYGCTTGQFTMSICSWIDEEAFIGEYGDTNDTHIGNMVLKSTSLVTIDGDYSRAMRPVSNIYVPNSMVSAYKDAYPNISGKFRGRNM